jgi:hypothetical protein
MVEIVIKSNKYDSEEFKKIVDNLLNQISEEDYFNLGSIYLTDSSYRKELLRYDKYLIDPDYLRRGPNGKPCITMSLEMINKPKMNIVLWIFLKLAAPFICLFLFIPILILCIKNRNFRFWYLARDGYLEKRFINEKSSRIERRLVTRLLYYIGIHKSYDLNISKGTYLNINTCEYAWKYRKNVLVNYSWSSE